MRNILTTAALALLAASTICVPQSTASAQDAILAEIYGRGVHAYYAGQMDQSYKMFSAAINGGSKDPRAYYFRGIVATKMGRGYEAESDWQQGATLEARASGNPAIGRSLSRFQGSARLKLEQIRQNARLQALTVAADRSNMRRTELGINSTPPPPAAVPPSTSAVAPPPTPPADENPFKDDSTNMAAGAPKVESDDALKSDPLDTSAMADTGAAAAGGDAAGGDPFGGGGAAGADPFGGGGNDAGADPFGGGSDGGADPFGGGGDAGGDPFGGGGDDAMGDPFGGGGSDPFGN